MGIFDSTLNTSLTSLRGFQDGDDPGGDQEPTGADPTDDDVKRDVPREARVEILLFLGHAPLIENDLMRDGNHTLWLRMRHLSTGSAFPWPTAVQTWFGRWAGVESSQGLS